jgi:hypothetical protein
MSPCGWDAKTLRNRGRFALVLYLIVTLLTGCSTVEMRIIDPTEPFKVETPLAKTMTLSVAMAWKEKPNMEHWEWFEPDLLNDLRQALLISGTVPNVQTNTQCLAGQTERTLCVTAKLFNQPEKPFYSYVLGGIGAFLVACLLFIPVFFIAADLGDRVIAEILLLDKTGKEIGRTEVVSEFESSIGFRKFNLDTIRQLYALNNKELANRVVLELKRHPHWFEPAR